VPQRDLLIRNGRIWTGGRSLVGCAVIQGGRFVFTGKESDANPRAGMRTLDAGGRLVLPGFIDGHAHLLNTGDVMRSVDLKGVTSVGEAARRVAQRIATTAKGEWILGAGWDQHLWPDARFPHREDLDAVAPGHPVLLTHTSGHCVWLNSLALQLADIDATTEAPRGGAIDVGADGEPSGILRDEAMALVRRVVPRESQDSRLDSVASALRHAASLGVTSVHAMDVGRGELEALSELHQRSGLSLRVRAFLTARRLDEWLGWKRTGDGDDLLRIGGVKFFADGALGSVTAWMHEAYEGADHTGLPLMSPEELHEQVSRCLEHGLAPAVHAIGDRANTEVLNIFERARAIQPALPRRIEHAQLLRAEDIARFAALDVTASVQPIHATQDMKKADRLWGARARHAYPFASLLRAGAKIAFGSDSPVETMNPIAGLHAAVMRRNADGEPEDGWYPEERLSLEDALLAYTRGCAAATAEETELGTIARGFNGDFVVLARDFFPADDPMTILDAAVDVTAVGGEIVYERA
jgi:predicted amidohydrolase YtcJ